MASRGRKIVIVPWLATWRSRFVEGAPRHFFSPRKLPPSAGLAFHGAPSLLAQWRNYAIKAGE